MILAKDSIKSPIAKIKNSPNKYHKCMLHNSGVSAAKPTFLPNKYADENLKRIRITTTMCMYVGTCIRKNRLQYQVISLAKKRRNNKLTKQHFKK